MGPRRAIKRHRAEARPWGLDDTQKKAIHSQLVEAQKQFLDAQLNLQEASEELQQKLQSSRAPETTLQGIWPTF